jgi:hypothetical protein
MVIILYFTRGGNIYVKRLVINQMVILLYKGWQHTCEAARESIKWLLYFTQVVNIHMKQLVDQPNGCCTLYGLATYM